jgi:subtilisin family serine protease
MSISVGARAMPGDSVAQGWAPGRLLVVPRPGLADAELSKILGFHGGKARRIAQSDIYVVSLPANASERAVQAILAHNPHLKSVELDRQVSPTLAVNDPYVGSEWHLTKIGAPGAWDASTGSGVTIAILDTGVDSTHPDLATRMVPGWNFYDNNSNTADVYGHGTKVAGAAAAASNNGLGVASVAGNARIMPIRISDTSGIGYWSMVAQGLTYAADHGARVANVSYSVAGSATVQTAAKYMKDKGGLVFVSAGNTGAVDSSAPTSTMIPVSATDGNDAMASWSTYGAFVALSAPGVSIYTTTSGGGYGAVNGTSFSSPVAAGVAALVMSERSSLTSSQVESVLFSTAVDLGAAGRDAYYGYGRVNAQAAVQAAASYAAAASDTIPPAVAIATPLGGSTVSGLATVDVSGSDKLGVTRVVLKVNGVTLATDSSAPFGFSWDTTKVANGMATLVAYAYDAAGNTAASLPVAVNVANNMIQDTTPPVVTIVNPKQGTVKGMVSVTTSASDNTSASSIVQTLFIDGKQMTSTTGASLSFNWNTKKVSSGTHTIQIVAKDAAGNAASSSVQVAK